MSVIPGRYGKIHFIHHLEQRVVPANLGDWIASPYNYFSDFFSRYTCVLHSVWGVMWHEIEKDDFVIFGGGGLLDNSDPLNVIVNRLFDKCNNVVIWGAGTHRYSDGNIFGKKSTTVEILYKKALMSGVRDYMHPAKLEFVPCASCLHPAFNMDPGAVKLKREVGVITSALERSFAVSNLPSSVTNAEPIGTVVEYILSSNVILVSSYHGAYWSMLLGRKVILPVSRLGVDKYKYFRHPVGFYEGTAFDEQELLKIASNLDAAPDFLAEARKLNLDFFSKVKTHIEKRIPTDEKTETIQILSKRIAQLEFTMIEMANQLRRMK